MKISVLIPVYNEFPTLRLVLERVRAAVLPPGCSLEIVVVDDGSTDGTTEVLTQFADAGLVTGHYSPANAGKGMALRIGIGLASGGIILVQDGDLEYDPQDYAALVEPLLANRADVVYGSRFAGRKPAGMAWKNRLANRVLTAAANLLYNAQITDEAAAYKAFRADLLRSVPLECRRFEFCPEITAKLRKMGHRIHEVPIRYNARGIADGKKIRARDGWEALWTLLKYRFVR